MSSVDRGDVWVAFVGRDAPGHTIGVRVIVPCVPSGLSTVILES